MLKHGIRFFCCATDDDSEAQNVVWRDNVLTSDILQARENKVARLLPLAMQATLQHAEPSSTRARSTTVHGEPQPIVTKQPVQYPLTHSLAVLTKGKPLSPKHYQH